MNGYERCYPGSSNSWLFLQFPLCVCILLHCRDWLLIAASLQPFINLRWQVGDSFIACIRWVKCKWNRPQILVFICICHPLHFFSSDTEVSLKSSEPKLPYLNHSTSEAFAYFSNAYYLDRCKTSGGSMSNKTPARKKKKTRIRVEREQVRNVSVPAVSHTVSKCCSAYVVIVVTSGHYSRCYDCCLLIGRLSVYEILQPVRRAPTTMTRSKSLQSPFFTFWWSLGTRASHVDHVYIPKCIELLPHDWLVCVNERLKVVPNKVANKWTSPFPAASTYWTGEIMRQMSLK